MMTGTRTEDCVSEDWGLRKWEGRKEKLNIRLFHGEIANRYSIQLHNL